jgi:hypothetical protein
MDYLQSYASSGLAVQSWWDSKCTHYLNMHSVDASSHEANKLARRRGDVSQAFAAAAELVNFGSAFKCCQSPRAISMDGIVLSVRSNQMPAFVRPWMMEGPEVSRGSTRALRQLPRLNEAQIKLLHDFIFGHTGCPRQQLLIQIQITTNAGLKLLYLIHVMAAGSREAKLKCSHNLQAFARFLCKSLAPVVSLVPKKLLPIIRNMYSGKHFGSSADRLKIETVAPVFFGLLKEFQNACAQSSPQSTEKLWATYKEFLAQIRVCHAETYKYNEDDLVKELSKDEQAKMMQALPRKHHHNSDLSELWSTGCYFPGYPICRKVKEIKIANQEAEACSKDYHDAASCAPGVVLFYCVHHEVCIGFVVLDQAESPRMVYEVLMTRFRNLPELVIYDNGCNLHEYILNRLPRMASGLQVMVDGFHFQSHVNCAPTYDTHKHPALTRNLNTSLFEQRNSLLARLKANAPLFLARTFFSFLRFAVGLRNIQRHHKIKDMKALEWSKEESQ